MNNKGFTVVELLASFTLTMIIMVFLFEIVLQLKDVYVTNALKTKIITKNAIVASTLNEKLKEITSASCEEKSCEVNTPSETIEIEYFIKNSTRGIIINDQIITYPDEINQITYNFSTERTSTTTTGDNAFIQINYTIQSDYLDKPITFNYVYSFKST